MTGLLFVSGVPSTLVRRRRRRRLLRLVYVVNLNLCGKREEREREREKCAGKIEKERGKVKQDGCKVTDVRLLPGRLERTTV